MSEYVSSINKKLSFNALEVACHAVEKHCDKLKNENHTDLVVSSENYTEWKQNNTQFL